MPYINGNAGSDRQNDKSKFESVKATKIQTEIAKLIAQKEASLRSQTGELYVTGETFQVFLVHPLLISFVSVHPCLKNLAILSC